jgi:hypothetical protein
MAGGIVSHHERAQRVHHTIEHELGPYGAHRIGDDFGFHADLVEQIRKRLRVIDAAPRRSEPGLALDQALDASRLDIAAGIHGDAAQDDCVRYGQQRFRVAHAILQRDKCWIANERATQLLYGGGSGF